MPRIKAIARKRTSDTIDPPLNERTPQPKRRSLVNRRRILQSAPKDAVTLGIEPVRCTWKNEEEEMVPPTCLWWSSDESDVLQFFVECRNVSIPITDIEGDTLGQFVKMHRRKTEIVFNSSTETELLLDIVVTILPWEKCSSIVEQVYKKDYSQFACNDLPERDSWEAFFHELSDIQRKRLSGLQGQYQHPQLMPILRSYQEAAVEWMVSRENIESTVLDLSWLPDVADLLPTRNGSNLLYCKFGERLCESFQEVSISSGGILADEMGLGKTVITIALILNHQRVMEEVSTEKTDHNYAINYGSSSTSDSDDDSSSSDSGELTIKDKNQEGCLDADEALQLVPNRGTAGLLKRNLNAWYEQKLAELRATPASSPSNRRSAVPFKCVCGEDVSIMPRHTVRCPKCMLSQHKHCVDFRQGFRYVCPACWTNETPIMSYATLIVTPQSIFTQWENEILRHAPTLTVFKYEKNMKFVQPSYMANFDVVLTTYNMLHIELQHTGKTPERRLRREERYLRVSSALSSINWWRIVCDEAQMVEGEISNKRRMIQLLTACHRWSVTGTPIQRGIGDLFYLTEFMGLGPMDDKSLWTDLLLTPYRSGCKSPLLSVLSQVFWRSCKNDVNEELGLPEQTFIRHLLKFSAIEESFYTQEHMSSAAKFSEVLRKSKIPVNTSLDSVEKSTMSKLLLPLLNLRQACTHPQVVSGITITSATGTANLDELLTFLSRRTKLHCEEALRRHIASLNGLAGLHCLELEWEKAMEYYRQVMRLAEEYKDQVQVDTMQRIHALTNAADLITCHSSVIPPTLRDDTLLEDANELQKKFLSKSENAFTTSYAQFKTLADEVKKYRGEFLISHESWWVPVLYSLHDYEGELLDKLSQDLHSNDRAEKSSLDMFLARIRTMRGVEMTLTEWWKDLEKLHKKAVAALSTLLEVPREVLVQQAVSCHLRSVKAKDLSRCELCKVERIMQDLECQLFSISRKEMKKAHEKVLDGAETKGSWKKSYEERAMNILYSFARSKVDMEDMLVKDGKLHGKLLGVMKKEFKQLRNAWTGVNHMIQAEDEIAMSKLRMRLADAWEIPQETTPALSLTRVNKMETINVIQRSHISSMMVELAAERDFSLSDFKKKLGQVLYLKNLEQTKSSTPDPCPVCKTALEKQWCVLQCGHCYCLACVQALGIKRVKCPVCREFTEGSELSFVDTSRVDCADVNVAGNFSTKIDGIVRTTLKLLKDCSDTKIIVFSCWPEVLKILAHALELNHVKCLLLKQHNHRQILKTFREPDSLHPVLLLPLSWGSKGLNLIEATHVFLTEPILNSAEELQAIGRIHRIGQTKPTFVHRFLIKGTIEEKISAAVSEAKDGWSDGNVTLDHLFKLFIMPPREAVADP